MSPTSLSSTPRGRYSDRSVEEFGSREEGGRRTLVVQGVVRSVLRVSEEVGDSIHQRGETKVLRTETVGTRSVFSKVFRFVIITTVVFTRRISLKKSLDSSYSSVTVVSRTHWSITNFYEGT